MRTIKVSEDIWEYLQRMKIDRKIRSMDSLIRVELGLIKEVKALNSDDEDTAIPSFPVEN